MMRPLLLVLCGLMLVGCAGYTPLYSKVDGGLRQVYVAEVAMEEIERGAGERRAAQLLWQELAKRFSTRNAGDYRLVVRLEENLDSIAVERDATDQRLRLRLIADVYLYDSAGDLVYREDLSTSSAYNVEDSPFGTDSGQERARQSATDTMGNEIILKISQFLARER